MKQFYRELSKKFHPDANPDTDTSQQMQLLNQLKNEWDCSYLKGICNTYNWRGERTE